MKVLCKLAGTCDDFNKNVDAAPIMYDDKVNTFAVS